MVGAGRRAQRSGKRLEDLVGDLLRRQGYVEVSAKQFSGQCSVLPCFARQYPIGENIYGRPRISDFIVYHPEKWPNKVLVECKWQGSSGTVHEKFPFLVENIRKTGKDTHIPTLVLLDGGGYLEEAASWLRAQQDEFLWQVCDLTGFVRMVNGETF